MRIRFFFAGIGIALASGSFCVAAEQSRDGLDTAATRAVKDRKAINETLERAKKAGLTGVKAASVDDELKALQAVTLVRLVNGKLDRFTVSRGNLESCCPGCVTFGRDVYYESVALANREAVSVCAQHAAVGTEIDVEYEAADLCRPAGLFKKKPTYETNFARYRLNKQADGVHLGMKLRMNIAKSVAGAKADRMMIEARACVAKIGAVWRRYGIAFDLRLDSNITPSSEKPDHQVDYREGEGRADHETYYYDEYSSSRCASKCHRNDKSKALCEEICERNRQDYFCLMMLHETAHLLGLPDEYEDEKCPGRPFVSKSRHPVSVMNDTTFGWSETEFFPRHIRQVVAPLCEQ